MSNHSFVFNGLPSRVVFGAGSLRHLQRELNLLGAQRALVLSTPQQGHLARDLCERLGAQCAGVFDKAVMHVPIESVQQAKDAAQQLSADCTVAIGGGSTVGLAKAIALESGLPIIAIPTTYAGSEMTPIYGITEAGVKRTGKHPMVLPRTVIYDPDLTMGLSIQMTVTSSINAIAHAAEGLYAQDISPIMALMAQEGIAVLARAIPTLYREPAHTQARADALYGAWLCGTVLGNVGMALHHKLCHTLGGSFNLPHAEVHTVILPHALAFNACAAPDAIHKIAVAIGSDSAPGGLFDLAKSGGAPLSLQSIGMKEMDLDRAAELAVSSPYWNPRPFGPAQYDEIRALLQQAFDGIRPE